MYPLGNSRRTIRLDLVRSMRSPVLEMGVASAAELDELDAAALGAFRRDLARSLNNLAYRLADQGRFRPLVTSQIRTDPSSLPEASQLPSGATATAFTPPVWPDKRVVASFDAVAVVRAENLVQVMGPGDIR
jgi:hypothetical protein